MVCCAVVPLCLGRTRSDRAKELFSTTNCGSSVVEDEADPNGTWCSRIRCFDNQSSPVAVCSFHVSMDSRPRGPKTAYHMEGNFIGPNYFIIRVNSNVGSLA
jgi:hypothetical protein